MAKRSARTARRIGSAWTNVVLRDVDVTAAEDAEDAEDDDDDRHLVEWMATPDCTMRSCIDRLALGHRVLTFVAGREEGTTVIATPTTTDPSAAELRRAFLAERERAEQALIAVVHAERDRADVEIARERSRLAVQHAEMLARVSDLSEARSRAEAREVEVLSRLESRETESLSRVESHLVSSINALKAFQASEASDVQLKQAAELQRLRGELDRLKGTNHVKGIVGEALVSSILLGPGGGFDAWSFVDTSSKGGESDFHLVCPKTGHVLVVEVKNKAIITSSDVTKSLRDARELKARHGDAMIGYLFVSLRSRCIPGKGALLLELLATSNGSVPLMWCGLEASDDAELASSSKSRDADLVHFARILVDAGRMVVALGAGRNKEEAEGSSSSEANEDAEETERRLNAAIQDAISSLNAQLDHLDGMRRIVVRLDESAAATRRHATAMQSAIEAAFRSLQACNVLATFHSKGSGQDSVGTSREPAGFLCADCGKRCATRAGLTNHSKTCSKTTAVQVPS